jgi:hypothetical protein
MNQFDSQSPMHVLFGLYKSATIQPEHIGISPAREGWTVANDNMTCLVAAKAHNVVLSVGATCRLGVTTNLICMWNDLCVKLT